MPYPDVYEFDVLTADHDAVKGGGTFPKRWVRVVRSREEFPTYAMAADTAACFAASVAGQMPLEVRPRY